MKTKTLKKLIATFAITFILFNSFAQSLKWNWQNPKPQGNYLYDIEPISGQNIVAIGNHGTIMRSSDLGTTWNTIDINYTKPLLDVHFINPNLGIIVGDSIILKSTDQGKTWVSKSFSGKNNFWDIEKVQMVNSTIGYAKLMFGNKILKTINGGESWTLQSLPIASGASFHCLYFFNADTGILVGGNYFIYKTKNAGLTWDSVAVSSNGYTDLVFKNSTDAFLIGASTGLLKTTNAGDSWTNFSSPMDGIWMEKLSFPSSNVGYACGWDGLPSSGKFFKSVDGGETWNEMGLGLDSTTFAGRIHFSINFLNEDNGFIVGNWGEILKTTNAGLNWSAYIPDNYEWLNQVEFFNDGIGFSCGIGNKVYKTSDTGKTWVKSSLNSSGFVRRAKVLNDSSAYILMNTTAGSILLISSDKATTWVKKEINSNDYWSAHFIDASKGFVVGPFGRAAKTINGGESWTEFNFPTEQYLEDITFSDAMKGIIVGDSSIKITTTDGGQNWNFSSNGDFAMYRKVQYISTQVGFILSSDGKLLKTDNGNLTFTNIAPMNLFSMRNFHFLDAQNGLIVTLDGAIYRTSTGGNTWLKLKSPCGNILEDVQFINSNLAFAVGEGSTILKYSREPGIGIDAEWVKGAALINIYPNPNRGVLMVDFSTEINKELTFQLFSVLGEKVFEDKIISNQAIKIQLPEKINGMFFYSIQQVGQTIASGKIIVLE